MTKKPEWLRALVTAAVAFAVSATQLLVRKDAPGGRVILIAIMVATFATIPLVFKIWPIPGERKISRARWALFFLILVSGLVVINFHFDEALAYWFMPLLVVVVGVVWVLFKSPSISQ